jgi:hypothetical protein
LNKEDKVLLEQGTLQVLLEKDTAGRPVMGCFTQLERIRNHQTMVCFSVSTDGVSLEKEIPLFAWLVLTLFLSFKLKKATGRLLRLHESHHFISRSSKEGPGLGILQHA